MVMSSYFSMTSGEAAVILDAQAKEYWIEVENCSTVLEKILLEYYLWV